MVVLSVAMCSKTGKAVLCRQYVEMTRLRIEGLVAAFPKLVGTGKKQHTYVETEACRYVYQPMEGLYLLLITNKGSNIMEDLDTLRLLSKVVPDQCGGLITEENVAENAFGLLFAFDEILTAGGYKENVTLQQIRTHLEMESHEEKLAMMIKASKINEAKEEGRRKADSIRDQRREQARLSKMGIGGGTASGFGGGGMGGGGGGGMGGGGMGGGGFDTFPSKTPSPVSSSPRATSPQAAKSPPTVRGRGAGMKLGSKKKSNKQSNLLAAMAEEGIVVPDASDPTSPTSAAAAAGGAGAAAAVAAGDAVSTVIEEKISVSMSRDGTLESMDIRGTLTLTINNPAASRCRVILDRRNVTGFQFQNHPNISKPLFASDAILALKNAEREFPVGNPVGVLRWRMPSKDESLVPLLLNCWPEEIGGGVINCNIEYTRQDLPHAVDLHNVIITIPLDSDGAPEVVSCDGIHQHDARERVITWHIDMIDASNDSGSLEFNIPSSDPDAFFPVTVEFQSATTICDIDVVEVQSLEDDSKVRCAASRALRVDAYTIE